MNILTTFLLLPRILSHNDHDAPKILTSDQHLAEYFLPSLNKIKSHNLPAQLFTEILPC